MAAKRPPPNPWKDLERRYKRVERHVGHAVHATLDKAERDLAKEEAKLVREMKALEKRVIAKERALERKVRAAIAAAERKAVAEERKLERAAKRGGAKVARIAQKGMWDAVDRLDPASAKAAKRAAKRRR